MKTLKRISLGFLTVASAAWAADYPKTEYAFGSGIVKTSAGQEKTTLVLMKINESSFHDSVEDVLLVGAEGKISKSTWTQKLDAKGQGVSDSSDGNHQIVNETDFGDESFGSVNETRNADGSVQSEYSIQMIDESVFAFDEILDSQGKRTAVIVSHADKISKEVYDLLFLKLSVPEPAAVPAVK